jgi:hypothetical protein
MIIPGLMYSQYVEIRAELDTNRILIGDQVNLNLSVYHPAEMEIRFPDIRDSLAGIIEVLRQGKIDTLINNDRLELRRKILLTCFDSGFYEIPPLPFGM